jgi:hypothetical protein
MAELDEVTVDDAVDITLELGPKRPPVQMPEARKTRSDDLSGVVLERQGRLALELETLSAEQFLQADGPYALEPLRQRKWPHPDRHDSACSGVTSASGGGG